MQVFIFALALTYVASVSLSLQGVASSRILLPPKPSRPLTRINAYNPKEENAKARRPIPKGPSTSLDIRHTILNPVFEKTYKIEQNSRLKNIEQYNRNYLINANNGNEAIELMLPLERHQNHICSILISYYHEDYATFDIICHGTLQVAFDDRIRCLHGSVKYNEATLKITQITGKGGNVRCPNLKSVFPYFLNTVKEFGKKELVLEDASKWKMFRDDNTSLNDNPKIRTMLWNAIFTGEFKSVYHSYGFKLS